MITAPLPAGAVFRQTSGRCKTLRVSVVAFHIQLRKNLTGGVAAGGQALVEDDGIGNWALDAPFGIEFGLNAIPPPADEFLGGSAAAESPGVADVLGSGDFFDASEGSEFGP